MGAKRWTWCPGVQFQKSKMGKGSSYLRAMTNFKLYDTIPLLVSSPPDHPIKRKAK